MKVLMLVNWKIEYCDERPTDKQPPDFFMKGLPYWFFRHFEECPDIDVMDISSFGWLENFEKNALHFYILQALKAIPKLNQYDIILSHGMQSAVVISLWRRWVKTKAKHIVVDVGSFASASEKGFALKLMQYASKSIDGLIYHTSSQLEYYKKFFPWLVEKSHFVRFGVDLDLFNFDEVEDTSDKGTYIICIGKSFRDWDTLIKAYRKLKITNTTLRLIGCTEKKYRNIEGVELVSFMPIDQLINQIYNAKLCVLPFAYCYNYSYGQMTLTQQMALKKCVIATKVPSLVDYVIDGETALFYDVQQADDLANKMQMCLDDDMLAQGIGMRARAWLQENCNERTMAQDIEKVLKLVLEND